MDYPASTDLFTHFQRCLSSAGGESHQAARLAEAAAVITAHPALLAGEIVVPPNFDQLHHWGSIIPLFFFLCFKILD